MARWRPKHGFRLFRSFRHAAPHSRQPSSDSLVRMEQGGRGNRDTASLCVGAVVYRRYKNFDTCHPGAKQPSLVHVMRQVWFSGTTALWKPECETDAFLDLDHICFAQPA